MPPFDGGTDGLKRKGPVWLMDVVRQAAECVAPSEATIIGPEHFGLFKSCFCVRPQGVNDGPEFQSVLKPFRCQDIFDDLQSELVFGSSPEGGKPKLCIGVHRRFLEDAFPWVEKLANECVVHTWLPFLDQGEFEAAIVRSFREERNGNPNVQVVVLLPVTKGQFSLHQSVIG